MLIQQHSFLFAVAFDPASFYGHHEFDLAIADMFGGFNNSFYNAYHTLIPKSPGFEQRHQLYLLFHHLNHWYVVWYGLKQIHLAGCFYITRNHFGSGYKGSTLQIMRDLVK
jgi:protein-ribulosamine 3-kinase